MNLSKELRKIARLIKADDPFERYYIILAEFKGDFSVPSPKVQQSHSIKEFKDFNSAFEYAKNYMSPSDKEFYNINKDKLYQRLWEKDVRSLIWYEDLPTMNYGLLAIALTKEGIQQILKVHKEEGEKIQECYHIHSEDPKKEFEQEFGQESWKTDEDKAPHPFGALGEAIKELGWGIRYDHAHAECMGLEPHLHGGPIESILEKFHIDWEE